MRYAKLITAGMLVLTVAALNDFQETVFMRAESFVQMRAEVMGLGPVAVLLEDQADSATSCKKVTGYPKTHVISNPHWGERVLLGIHKWVYQAISKFNFLNLYESYSLMVRLLLSKPVLPLMGS